MAGAIEYSAAAIRLEREETGAMNLGHVTSPLHSYRASRTFQRARLEVIGTLAAPGFDARVVTDGEDHLAGGVDIVVHSLYEYVSIGRIGSETVSKGET